MDEKRELFLEDIRNRVVTCNSCGARMLPSSTLRGRHRCTNRDCRKVIRSPRWWQEQEAARESL